MTTPLIAVPTAHVEAGAVRGWRTGGFAVAETYVDALRRAGARPVLLPAGEPAPAEEVLAPFDGVLLTGGGDLQAGSYGAQAHAADFDVQPERDDLELSMVRACRRLDLPLLGVCRGLQAVNVALGGSLHQHLLDLPGLISHGHPFGGDPVVHDVRIQPGTRLAVASGATTVHAIARHHQAVDRLGAGLVATAWTEDGIVEGIELTSGWLVAVQWHPEASAATDPTQQGLFDVLVEEAGKRALARVA
jgi:putative glutamine amidotransferase